MEIYYTKRIAASFTLRPQHNETQGPEARPQTLEKFHDLPPVRIRRQELKAPPALRFTPAKGRGMKRCHFLRKWKVTWTFVQVILFRKTHHKPTTIQQTGVTVPSSRYSLRSGAPDRHRNPLTLAPFKPRPRTKCSWPGSHPRATPRTGEDCTPPDDAKR